MILTQVMAVIVTELDMKLRPLFRLTWRVADLQDVEENSSHLRLKTFFFLLQKQMWIFGHQRSTSSLQPPRVVAGVLQGGIKNFCFFQKFCPRFRNVL